MRGDYCIGSSLAYESGLILVARWGKQTEPFIKELVNSTMDKTDCQNWNSDDWEDAQRILPETINHRIGKDKTQGLERTNQIIRRQTGK